jgi:hypothetical protein
MTGHPLGEFNKLKTGIYPTGYNYKNAITSPTSMGPCYIYNVDTSKIRDSVLRELNPTVHIGFIDFEIGNIRYPRI